MHFSDIVLSEGYLPAGSMSLFTLKTYYYDYETFTLPVLEKEKVVNILSLSDLESSGLSTVSSDASADPIICAHPEDLLETYVDLKQSILPVVNKDGTYAGFISLLHLRQILQATQSLRSKQKHLEEINEEYEMILETSHDVVQVTDEKGTTLRMSRSSETIDGISPSQLLGKSMKEMVDQSLYSKSAAMEVLKLQKPVTITQSVNNDKEVLATGTPFFKDGRLYRVVVNARDITELNKLRNEVKKVEYIKEELQMLRSKTLALPDTVVKNKKMQNIFSVASRVADVDSTILLFGESGVGKGVIAKYIHKNSRRADGPFIKIDVSAIPENLLESELFGYVKGAFTGAASEGKPGMVALAENGTLFLDEIGELPIQLQPKLLRLIQERTFIPVGGQSPQPINIRVIAATHRNLEEMIKEGTFREDLYYRLNVVPFLIPPLKERTEEILPFVFYYLKQFNTRYHLKKEIQQEALHYFTSYDWPGNIRELQNIIERLVVTSKEDLISKEELPELILHSGGTKDSQLLLDQQLSLKKLMERYEKNILTKIASVSGDTKEAADWLGLDRSTIRRKFKKHSIPFPEKGNN